MGLLAPLYALAALAIAGPILFHLIRRQPQGQLPFSSLMFLRTSPPRLTRRSRLDNLWLLILRGLALLLVALAFSRPYWRQQQLVSQSGPARTVAILVDTSASMRRPDVWQAALAEARAVLDDLSVQDVVALYTFDTQLEPVVPLSTNAASADAEDSRSLVRSELSKMKPAWSATNISAGLIQLSEQLSLRTIGTDGQPAAHTNSQIVLITDFHQDSGIDGLQSITWPSEVAVDLRIVRPEQAGNARASLMKPDAAEPTTADELKIRIENNSDSTADAFQLQWTGDSGETIGPLTSIQVPAGQVRVVTMSARPEGARQIRLNGDAWSDDNTVFVPQVDRVKQRVLYCGSRHEQPEDDLSFFLAQAPLSTSMFQREVESISLEELSSISSVDDAVALVVEPTPTTLPDAKLLRQLAEDGISLIVVLSEQSSQLPTLAGYLNELLSSDATAGTLENCEVAEARSDRHAMVSQVDYRSAVFSALADSRFNDFSKIRIWSHRRVSWAGLNNADSTDDAAASGPSTVRVLARLDDQSPWLIQQSVGNGHVTVLTSGWQTKESSFALSSKFIPVMMRLIDPSPRQSDGGRVVAVGESVAIEDQPPLEIADISGKQTDVRASISGETIAFAEPGLYQIKGQRWDQQLAVQLPANESHLTPMDPVVLEQFGLNAKALESDADIQDRLRQMQTEELEQRQRLWKWLLVAGLGILLLETFAAGWASKRVPA